MEIFLGVLLGVVVLYVGWRTYVRYKREKMRKMILGKMADLENARRIMSVFEMFGTEKPLNVVVTKRKKAKKTKKTVKKTIKKRK